MSHDVRGARLIKKPPSLIGGHSRIAAEEVLYLTAGPPLLVEAK